MWSKINFTIHNDDSSINEVLLINMFRGVAGLELKVRTGEVMGGGGCPLFIT